MHWKDRYRSFYYQNAEIPDLELDKAHTALLVIDIQNTYMERPDPASLNAGELAEYEAWEPFHQRMNQTVVPTVQKILSYFRTEDMPVFHARIACLTPDGADRSLSQRRPGFNNLLLPYKEHPSQIFPVVAPQEHEIVVTKTTDSALTGTNLRLLLHNMGVENVVVCGIFTDQCVASTVRSLADESFNTVVIEDGCAAGSDELHHKELEIINNIYCQVVAADELFQIIGERS
jgi:nicotinamidase-related amidase